MGFKRFIWDPVTDAYLGEQDETGATIATYTQEPVPYGSLISQRRGGQTSYYHYDGLGNTRELTSASEVVTDTNLYDAWGVNVASTGTTKNPFKWRGQDGYYIDERTGDYYVRARTYQPGNGRWMSIDPLVFVLPISEIRLQPYDYSHNSPLSFIDPSGEAPYPLGPDDNCLTFGPTDSCYLGCSMRRYPCPDSDPLGWNAVRDGREPRGWCYCVNDRRTCKTDPQSYRVTAIDGKLPTPTCRAGFVKWTPESIKLKIKKESYAWCSKCSGRCPGDCEPKVERSPDGDFAKRKITRAVCDPPPLRVLLGGVALFRNNPPQCVCGTKVTIEIVLT